MDTLIFFVVCIGTTRVSRPPTIWGWHFKWCWTKSYAHRPHSRTLFKNKENASYCFYDVNRAPITSRIHLSFLN
jgi:hypothetical protein